MDIKAFIFDMDGLLFDSERIVQRSWEIAGDELGIPHMGDVIYHTLGMNRAGRNEYFRKYIREDFPFEEFGKLMNESHRSLRDDYEVSCKEIDILVDLAWETEGVIGSRITGGGFGGCTVSIVKNEAVDGFIKNIGEQYLAKVGHEAEFYVVDIGDGARVLNG